jgi:hypothetical protein
MNESRQARRHRLRSIEWDAVSAENALRDENGIIKRKVRRSIALVRFHRIWEELMDREHPDA